MIEKTRRSIVTMHHVAEKAGVTIGTVSRFINGYRLRAENERRVREAVRDTGYQVNLFAKGLRSNNSLTIGIVIKDLRDIFASTMAAIIEDELGRDNYSIIVCDFKNDSSVMEQKLRFLADRSIDGVILFSRYEHMPIFEEYERLGIPIVLMGENIRDLTTDKIYIDHLQASRLATGHLIEAGHHSIGIINGWDQSFTAIERHRGFIETLAARGLDAADCPAAWSDFTTAGGYAATLQLMSADRKPTALYVTNYYMAVGALMAVNELGLKIPEQLSFVGFDRLEPINLVKPSITAVEQPIRQMAIEAAKIMLRRVRGDDSDRPKTQVFAPTLFLGESVRRPAARSVQE